MAYTENDLARFMENELRPGDTFQFGCDMCGNCCRRRSEPILMTGADLFRVAQAIGTSVEGILPKNFEGYVGNDSHVPLYVLAERLDGSCRFLRKGQCMIHQAKPAVCALYPLGRIFNVQTGTFHYFVNTDRCHPGQPEGRIWTLEEWLDTFHIRETETMTMAWHNLMNSLVQVTHKMPKEAICGDLLDALHYELYLGYDTSAPYIEQVESRMDAAQRIFGKK